MQGELFKSSQPSGLFIIHNHFLHVRISINCSLLWPGWLLHKCPWSGQRCSNVQPRASMDGPPAKLTVKATWLHQGHRSNGSHRSTWTNGWTDTTNHIGAFHNGSARGSAQKFLSWAWAELDLSLQCEHSSAQNFSVGLEFLIRAAGCSH